MQGDAYDVGEFIAASAWREARAPAAGVERVCAGLDGTQR